MKQREIKTRIDQLERQRAAQIKQIDAELAKLRTLCEHKNTISYPARPGDATTECLDCGKWF